MGCNNAAAFASVQMVNLQGFASLTGHVTEQMKKDSAQRMERFIKGVSGL